MQNLKWPRAPVVLTLLAVAVLALAPVAARADEVTVAGTTSASGVPLGITFTNGSFSGTTAGGFAGFSNLGSFTLSTSPRTYTGDTLSLLVVFTLPSGIAGGGSSTFTATLFGSVSTTPGGGVTIAFSPTQTFSFSNAGGSGSFSFTLNTVSVNPGGTVNLSGSVSSAVYTPAPEPGTLLLLGSGLAFLLLFGRKMQPAVVVPQ